MPDQLNTTNIPSNRVEFIDPRTGLVSREWYRFFLNLFTLAGSGSNQITLDELQIGPPPQPVTEGGGGGSGTVTSVNVSGGTTGLTTSGGPITSAGTITMAGTLNVANGGTGATTAAGAPFALKGANADITSMSGLTGNVGAPLSIQMGNGSATTLAAGKMWYNETTGSWNIGMGNGNITQQIGEETFIYGKASAAITEGQLICKTGTVGASGVITFGPSPTGLTENDGIIGLATENIAINGFGRITAFGVVHGINTTGSSVGETWADNDTLYYNPSYAGGLTKVKPSAPYAKFEVGTVINAGSGGSGSIQVDLIHGSTLGGTDSNVQFGTLANNDLIAYDSGLGYWKNIPSSTFGTGSVTSVGTAGTVNGLTLTGGPITTSGTITLGGTLDLSSPPAIGGTTPAAGTFTTLIGGKDQVNYGQLTGGATTKAVEFKTLGSDTNVSLALRSKGTGAIDLAAGSSGVNISNGGTVTAITRTATGSGYTSAPTVAVTAPTTAGGVQATVSCTVGVGTFTVGSGGTGYTVNDVLTVVGGTGTAATFTVSAVSGGVVTSVTSTNAGSYSVVPSSPVSTTGGTGTGCTINITGYAVTSGGFTITNAGSGYVEQPTVTFSGGGGSGAAAYATVGSTPKVQTLGSNLSFYTPGGEQFRIAETTSGLQAVNFIQTSGNSSGAAPRFLGVGADANVGIVFSSKGTGDLSFRTNGTNQTQLVVSHTASSVNYVQVTGAATGTRPIVIANGSDANIGLQFQAKGTTSNTVFYANSGSTIQFVVNNSTGGANYLSAFGAAAATSPSLQATGTDTNIDLALTPKGTGVVKTSGTGLRLSGSSSGYVGLKGAAAAGSTTYTLPAADGTSGQVLSTDGAATLSWATPSGGSSNITAQGMWENALTISSNYTITSGNSAMSAGPITIASGVSVTVPSGSRWVVV